MSSLHNDIATWSGKARARGQETIEIDVDTADKIAGLLTFDMERVEAAAKAIYATLVFDGEKVWDSLDQNAEEYAVFMRAADAALSAKAPDAEE